MANEYVNKVVLGSSTLIDLTADTVTPSTLMQGYTAHDKSGALITGTASATGGVTQDQDGYLVLDDEGGGGSSVIVESLSVTQNGTYTAPTGKAYSPVTVNVSGGGGGSVKMGVLRPDAELVQRWTYDRYLVQDEDIAIPSYSTSAQTMVGTTNLQTFAPDYDTYDYEVLQRYLAIPTYATESTASYRQCYYFGTSVHEIVEIPSQTITWGSGTINSARVDVKSSPQYWSVYWYNDFLQANAQQYGAYFATYAPTVATTTGGNITVRSPALMLRGGASFPQGQWDDLTDVRYQYVLELYRTAKGAAYDGYSVKSQFIHAIECAQSASGTLT